MTLAISTPEEEKEFDLIASLHPDATIVSETLGVTSDLHDQLAFVAKAVHEIRTGAPFHDAAKRLVEDCEALLGAYQAMTGHEFECEAD